VVVDPCEVEEGAHGLLGEVGFELDECVDHTLRSRKS
jgi:hypothetical protein